MEDDNKEKVGFTVPVAFIMCFNQRLRSKKVLSLILSESEMWQLMKLCHFSLELEWTCIYRATQNGFEAEKFHENCDYKPNNLILIKSVNGNVFGGYTQKDWSGNNVFKVEQKVIDKN